MIAFSTTSDVWLCAGWTMLHYLWFGTVVALLAFTSRWALRRASSDARYAVALGWLALLAGAPVGIAVWVSTCHIKEQPLTAPNHRHVGNVSFPLPGLSAPEVESREAYVLPEVVSAGGQTLWDSTRREAATGADSLTVGLFCLPKCWQCRCHGVNRWLAPAAGGT